MDSGDLLLGIIALVVIAGIVGAGWYANWYIYQQHEMYTGVVSSYYCSPDFLGYDNCELKFYGGEGLNWSTWSFFPLNYVGNDINAIPGDTCRLYFVGEFMQKNYTCVNTTKG